MKARDIEDLDLNGILFVHFPDAIPLDECRERLELLAYEEWQEDTDGLEEDEKPQLVLSPYWVFRALFKKHMLEMRKKKRSDIKTELEWCWEYRLEKMNERKVKEMASGIVNPS